MTDKILMIVLMIATTTSHGQCPDIPPTSDFSANFCNIPFGWSVARGENVDIAVLAYGNTDKIRVGERIQKLAPESAVHYASMANWINRDLPVQTTRVVYIANEVKARHYKPFIAALEDHSNITVILPAYFGPMEEERDYSAWKRFIRKASEGGAVISGAHGDMYQLGDLSFWQEMPVDVFAVMGRQLNGFQPMQPGYKIQKRLESSSYLVVGATALVKSRYPDISNAQIKKLFRERGRRVHWSLIEMPQGKKGVQLAVPHLDGQSLGKYEDDRIKKIQRNVFEASSLDLMKLFDFSCPAFGGWSLKNLNIGQAREKATGKDVVVAILDHSFNKNHRALQGRITKPKSFINNVPALSEKSDHGTTMALDLVNVAPDVRIVPVVIAGAGHWGEPELYIKGIRYAIDNGADIISCSQTAVRGDPRSLDKAIEYAADKGVVFVYINYEGDRDEVIVPGAIEFEKYHKQTDRVNVIGTNFLHERSPITWGLSHTAPLVSGVIALMKEVNPDLQPAEVERILLESTRQSANGKPLLDASRAVQKAERQ
jgi:hypothetical protein